MPHFIAENVNPLTFSSPPDILSIELTLNCENFFVFFIKSPLDQEIFLTYFKY